MALIVATGCRTYGRYDSEPKTVAEIERINEQFARALSRAEADRAALRSAASEDARLQPLSHEFEAVVADHSRIVAGHETAFAALESGAGYRSASRLLGAIVTDQHSITDRYRSIAQQVRRMTGHDLNPLRDPSTYQQVPPYYVALQNNASLSSVAEAIKRTP